MAYRNGRKAVVVDGDLTRDLQDRFGPAPLGQLVDEAMRRMLESPPREDYRRHVHREFDRLVDAAVAARAEADRLLEAAGE